MQEKGQPIRWTVSVLGRSARGLLRDCTSYHTDVDRLSAEADAIAEAVRRWPASTWPIEITSYHDYPGDLQVRTIEEVRA